MTMKTDVGAGPLASACPSVAELRGSLHEWLDEMAGTLGSRRGTDGSLESEMSYNAWLYGELWDKGFTRWGWPESVGGLPGPHLLRAMVSEELTFARAIHQNIFFMPEILGTAFAAFASEDLIEQYLGRYLRGEEWWCQGFSEPGAGSDLASLSTRAVLHGDAFVVNGQKVWTSLAQFADRCLLLTRTGPAGSGHRGITALFVDMKAPGVVVRPLRGMHDEDEYSEVFLTDVEVPVENVVGEVDGGWAVAMQTLASERATIFWTRAAWLHDRLTALIGEVGPANARPELIGNVYQLVSTLRSVSLQTQRDVAAGTFSQPSSSIDKTLMAQSEQLLFDTARDMLGERLVFGDDRAMLPWRSAYMYSRAATIFGGTAEIQRNIISERLLGLPREGQF